MLWVPYFLNNQITAWSWKICVSVSEGSNYYWNMVELYNTKNWKKWTITFKENWPRSFKHSQMQHEDNSHLICEGNQKKPQLQAFFDWSCGLMRPDPVPDWWVHSDKRSNRWSNAWCLLYNSVGQLFWLLLCAENMKSADFLDLLNNQVFQWCHGYIPGHTGLKLWKSVWWCIVFTQRLTVQTLSHLFIYYILNLYLTR